MNEDEILDRLYAKFEEQKENGKLLSEANFTLKEKLEHAIQETIDKLFYLESFLCTMEKAEKKKND